MSPASDQTDAPLATSSAKRLLLLAAIMGSLAAGTFIAALFVREMRSQRVPALGVMAALLLGLKIGVDRIARWAAPSQGVVATSLTAAGLGPLFVVGALWAMGDPIVASSWRCGTPEANALMAAPIAFFLSGSLGTLLAAGVLGAGRGEAFRPLLRRAAILTTLAAGALVLLSVVRAAGRPDIDRYIDSLPVTATLPPFGQEGLVPRTAPVDELSVRAEMASGLAIYRHCWVEGCDVAVDEEAGSLSAGSPELSSCGIRSDSPISVRRDDAHHFIVLEGPDRIAFGEKKHFPGRYPPDKWRGKPRSLLWAALDVGVRDVADSASPPAGWIASGAAGLLAACALLSVNALRSRRLRAVLAGAPGTLGENGWIHFEDGRPAARVDPGAGLGPGPVLVSKGAEAPGVYRESDLLGASRVVAGTRQDWEERAAARAADLHAWAIATATLGAAPLVAAMTAGLVV
jgi:hypothetical protein